MLSACHGSDSENLLHYMDSAVKNKDFHSVFFFAMNTFVQQTVAEVTDATISFRMEQFHCLTNLNRSVYHDAVLREKLQDDENECGTKRQNEASGFKLYDLCFKANFF